MLVVDQLVVGARGWSASGRLLSQLYLSVGKASDVVVPQLEVGEGWTPDHFVGRRLVLVLLPLLRYDIWGATFERDVEFVGHRLIRLLFRLLALQSSNLVKGLRAWTARHRAHKLNVHSKVDTNKLILVQISVAVHALYTEERPWTRFKLLGRAGFIVINFIRLAFILVIVVTICSGFHRLGRRRI